LPRRRGDDFELLDPNLASHRSHRPVPTTRAAQFSINDEPSGRGTHPRQPRLLEHIRLGVCPADGVDNKTDRSTVCVFAPELLSVGFQFGKRCSVRRASRRGQPEQFASYCEFSECGFGD